MSRDGFEVESRFEAYSIYAAISVNLNIDDTNRFALQESQVFSVSIKSLNSASTDKFHKLNYLLSMNILSNLLSQPAQSSLRNVEGDKVLR